MTTPEPPRVSVSELRTIVTDDGELSKGARICDDGGLTHLSRYQHKLFADAAGSQIYKVQLVFDDKGVRGRCSCMAARSRPFCKHAAALLVAWARAPESFAVAEQAPPGAAEKKAKVAGGAVDARALMAQGVEQVSTLTRELAVTGAAALADDRAAQIRALGENLREHKLRRLSAKAIALAELLARGGGEDAYAELIADLVLTARKLEKHLVGEPLDPRLVEELIGKTWGKKDRAPVTGLTLAEVAYREYRTADGFVIRDSRLLELTTGEHFSEKQILPKFLVKRTAPKPSHAGVALREVVASAYPSYPPRRLDLEPGEGTAITDDDLATVIATALPDIRAVLAAFQEHRKDVFAPDAMPLTLASARLVVDRGRIAAVDHVGAGLILEERPGQRERLAAALASAALVAIVGDLTLDGAVPTLRPLAVIVREVQGLALRSVAIGDDNGAAPATLARTWATTARALGLSSAAIALGEVRTELAGLLYTGLGGATARRLEPLVARLRELGLGKPAEALAALAGRALDDRRDEFIKLYQVLSIALTRVATSMLVDGEGLLSSPQYPSVSVRVTIAAMTPAQIVVAARAGELDHFAAAVAYARHYQAVPHDQLLGQPLPAWADGGASPYIAQAATADPVRARATALALLAAGGVDGPGFPQVDAPAPPRTATVTALRVLVQLGDGDAVAALESVARRHRDHAVRALARSLLDRSRRVVPDDLAARHAARHRLRVAGNKSERAAAAARLVELGDLDALPDLRAALLGDAALEVRAAAARSLAQLGDSEAVTLLIEALDRRELAPAEAEAAALALGELGDGRGLEALLAAYQDAWRPTIVAQALAAAGAAGVGRLVDHVEAQPAVLKRATAHAVVRALPPELLRTELLARIDASVDDLAAVCARGAIYLDLTREVAGIAMQVGARLLAVPGLDAPKASKAARALVRRARAAAEPPTPPA